MAITANKGSKQVRYFRDQQERKNAQEKHWELAGTRIGDIMGVKAKPEEVDTSTSKDYRFFFKTQINFTDTRHSLPPISLPYIFNPSD